MLFLLSWSLQPLWSAPRLHPNPAQQCFPSSQMTPPHHHLISIHPTCGFFTEYRCFTSLSSSSAKTDPEKTQQNRLMPSSGRIPQVQICCVLVQTIPPSFLESNQLFPFHLSSQSSPTHPLTGPPDPSSPVCTGVVTPQATMYGQVLFSASLYVQYLPQLVFSVMIWGGHEHPGCPGQLSPSVSSHRNDILDPCKWYQFKCITGMVMQESVQGQFRIPSFCMSVVVFCQ